LKVNGLFEGTCQPSNSQQEKLRAGLLIGLLINPDDGGDTFLRTVGLFSPDS
jgi:hypothetical protein